MMREIPPCAAGHALLATSLSGSVCATRNPLFVAHVTTEGCERFELWAADVVGELKLACVKSGADACDSIVCRGKCIAVGDRVQSRRQRTVQGHLQLEQISASDHAKGWWYSTERQAGPLISQAPPAQTAKKLNRAQFLAMLE